jgi:hypothetical protein
VRAARDMIERSTEYEALTSENERLKHDLAESTRQLDMLESGEISIKDIMFGGMTERSLVRHALLCEAHAAGPEVICSTHSHAASCACSCVCVCVCVCVCA